MVRTVTDAAILLNVLRSPFGEVRGRRLPRDYRSFLVRGSLQGARIGVDRRLFDGGESTDAGLNAVTERALDVMRSLGVTLVDPITPPDTKSINDDELTVLFSEFKVDIEAYLAGLRGTSLRTLGDLIAFNDEHCDEELGFYGQELFHVADATTGLDDPAYRTARARCLAATRTSGIDRILAADRLDAIVGPAYGDSSAPAVAGYPAISVPTGTTDDGRPGGVWLSAGFLGEPALLGFAFDLESELGGRPRPTFAGTLPDLPPDAGICAIPVADRPRTRRSDLPDDA
jgi:amidase